MTAVEVDDRFSVFSPRTTQVLMLNDSASDLWRLADGEHTLDEVVELLARAYSSEPAAVRGDVQAMVAELVEAGLLPEVGDVPAPTA